MKTRLLIFTRQAPQESDSVPQILFAHWSDSLFFELPQNMGVEDFARQHKLRRHPDFDYSVGDLGRSATLLECAEPLKLEILKVGAGHIASQTNQYQPSAIVEQHPRESQKLPLIWENFRATAAALAPGPDRRFLQLAVQFLAAGARLDESVIAADYDAEFLQTLRKTLDEKSEPKKE